MSDNNANETFEITRENLNEILDEMDMLEGVISRYRLMLDSQGDIIYRQNAGGTLTFVNDRFVEIAGQRRETLLGQVYELPKADGLNASSLEDEPSHTNSDEWLITPLGERCFNWQSFPMIIDDHTGLETLYIGRDVTDKILYLRTQEEARRKAEEIMAMKGRFLSTVAHEIRTPINGIMGLIDLLMESELSASQENYSMLIAESSRNLLHLVNDLLDFEKVSQGKMPLSLEPVRLENLVSDVAELLAPKAQEKSIELTFMIDPALFDPILLDGKRVKQILLNLIGNAVKFTDNGGVALWLRQVGTGPAATLECRVEDTGSGIAEDSQQRIFQEFEQVVSNNKAKEGTGLGLAIARKLTQLMDGDITLTSTLGQGSIFSLTLPLKREVGYLASQEDSYLRGLEIAIESPNDMILRSLSEQSERLGALIFDGKPIKTKTDNSKKLHLLDYALGENTITKRLSKLASHNTPAIVLVTPNERSVIAELKRQGAKGYLIKPIRPSSLINLINNIDLAIDLSQDTSDTQQTYINESNPVKNNKETAKIQTLSAIMPSDDPAIDDGIKTANDHQTSLSSSLIRKTPNVMPLIKRIIKSNKKPVSVLVAEDNDINALLLENMLERLGATSVRKPDGLTAVESFVDKIVNGNPYDLLIFDMRMPDMDGAEAIAQIRTFEKDIGDNFYTPAVCLSASTFEDEKDICLESGFDKLLQKPIEIETLQPLIRARA